MYCFYCSSECTVKSIILNVFVGAIGMFSYAETMSFVSTGGRLAGWNQNDDYDYESTDDDKLSGEFFIFIFLCKTLNFV